MEVSNGVNQPLRGTCSLGRSTDNTIVLSDKRVSRRHALIYVHRDGGHWLVDFGSSNGILLNERLVREPVLLRHGDRLVIADFWLRYHNPPGTQAKGTPVAAAGSEEKTERLPQMLRSLDRGFIFLTPAGTIQYGSDVARRWLKQYFSGSPAEDVLPAVLREWVKRQLAGGEAEPFMAESGGRRVVVRFERDERQQLLVLAEHTLADSPAPLRALGLSERESEVLHWILQGKNTPEIAVILGLSPRTVDKHFQHIYEKLGVETRTAAMLRAMELLGLPGASG
jgi:DNA-binding CsgD family transcriptional regulator